MRLTILNRQDFNGKVRHEAHGRCEPLFLFYFIFLPFAHRIRRLEDVNFKDVNFTFNGLDLDYELFLLVLRGVNRIDAH